eukprot:IDg1529t1
MRVRCTYQAALKLRRYDSSAHESAHALATAASPSRGCFNVARDGYAAEGRQRGQTSAPCERRQRGKNGKKGAAASSLLAAALNFAEHATKHAPSRCSRGEQEQ